MASSFTSNTLQRREIISSSFCKCFSISTISPLPNSFTFSSSKRPIALKFAPFILVITPVTAISPVKSRIFSSLDYNSSTNTVKFRRFTENLGAGYSSSSKFDEERIVDRKNGGGFSKNSRKSRNCDEKINFGKRSEKGSENSSAKTVYRREERKMEGVLGKVAINSNGNVRRELKDIRHDAKKGELISSKWVKESNSKIVDGNVSTEFIKEGGNSKGKVKKKEKSKKNKVNSPEFELRVGLDMCSKKGDVMGAISRYDSAVKQGVRMGQYPYTVLLYLCSSAAMGVIRPAKSGKDSRSLDTIAQKNSDEENESDEEDDYEDDDKSFKIQGRKDETLKLEVNEIRVSDDVKKYALEKGFEVYERMCLDKVQMNEAALTSVARMAMAMGDGDKAFDMVKQMKSMGLSPKLRSYGPALSVFSSNGKIDKAFAVEEHMLENGVYPEEPELEALLRVSVETGKSDRVYYVLQKLRTNVRSVSPATAELIEKWFKSKASSRIGKRKWDHDVIAQTMEKVGGGWHGKGWLGRGKWSVSRTTITRDGLCKCCGEKLALIDLDPEETERFAESVAAIAIKRDKNSSFQKFQRWLDYYGPFEAVVDAANVGLFSQRKFKPSKVNVVVNGIREMLPSMKWPLIILHNRRVTGGKLDKPIDKDLVEKWRNADALYATPTGSNDDWYWLYASIKFKCLLVTNDEMRDHTFQLLGNDFFPKWKERHQVRFSFSELGPVFHMPPPCSVVIQESARGHWHIPIFSEHQSEEERIWLCVTRPKSLIKNHNHIDGTDSEEDSEGDIKDERQHGSSNSRHSHQIWRTAEGLQTRIFRFGSA
ncbi:proteinaceous RNase P 1, chloroplastic/mitochondrial-like isoform X2 [Amaranthus tricolor]|uniref:proteinaceous RNase P 1, chloroplastic/mitochondrial-like isoform X2 n=1 Tax=Amaranthus tricolor TaxID=29722 RepID=UPI002589DF40|nr:proteinaceous RNase P 1, chloroplastic/mitochondrial-like isoform X2 [Amaranthus tricolor]